MRILVIGAHPADPIDLAGGTIFSYAREGHQIILVSLTDGARSHFIDSYWLPDGESRGQVKREEFHNAADKIGALDRMIYHFQDEPLMEDPLAIAMVVDLIRSAKPDILITHHPNEYAHWDHAACGGIVCRALKAAIKLAGEKYWVPTVYFFAVQFRPEVSRLGYVPQSPDILINLGRIEIEEKIKALMCFKSQGLDDEQKLWKRINSFEAEMGRADGLEFSEGFCLYYPLKVYTLPRNMDGGFYAGK